MQGPYGYYSVRSNGSRPEPGLHHARATSTRTTWGSSSRTPGRSNNRLTVNVGVRTEREHVPTYTTGRRHPGVRCRVRLQATSSRRASAPPTTCAATASGRSSARGAVLRHLQAGTAPRLVRRRQVDRVLLHARHARLAEPAGRVGCPPACPGTFIRQTDFRHPSFGSDCDRSGPEADAAAGGHGRPRSRAERHSWRSASTTSTSRSTARSRTRARSTPTGNEIYVIANPGEGLTALAFTDPSVDAAEAEARLRQRRVLRSTSGSRTTGRCARATCGAASTGTTRA